MTARATHQFVIAILSCLQASLAFAQAPTAAEIEAAINEGVDLEYAPLQGVMDTTILKGGETTEGDFLFLCNADLVWNFGSEELIERFKGQLYGNTDPSDNNLNTAPDDAPLDPDTEPLPPDEELFPNLFPPDFELFPRLGDLLDTNFRMQLGEFEAGDEVHSIRMRVRIESAGPDWIVTHLDTSTTVLNGNPLDSLKTSFNTR